MERSKLHRRIALIFAVIGILSGVIGGFIYPSISIDGTYYTHTVEHYNVTLLLCVLSATIFVFLLIYGFSIHFENQEKTIELLQSIVDKDKPKVECLWTGED